MKISACIISRKEDQDSLNSLLDSIVEHVDEVVIVDTSSNGSLKPKLYSSVHNDYKIAEFSFHNFTWTGNFADARNFSFSKATGGVLFWADSDDVVRNPENIRVLAKHIEDGTVDWIYSDYEYSKDENGMVNARHWKYRLLRANTGEWKGRVHEDYIPNQAVIQGKDKDIDPEHTITIEHTATIDHAEESAKRNLAIQLQEIEEEGDKVDPRTIQYTGMSLQGLGRYDEAIQMYIRHIKVSGSQEDKFWSAQRIAMCLIFLGNYDEALTPALDSLKIFPQWSLPYFRLAEIYSHKEEWTKVIEWTLIGMEKKSPDSLNVLSDLDLGFLPMGRLAHAYLHTGNYELAMSVAKDMAKLSPNDERVKELLAACGEALKTEGFVQSFLEVAQNVKKHDRTKAVQLFDLIPKELDDDIRIQQARAVIVPPVVWGHKSVVIYCGKSIEEWAYPSQFTGIGGSEEAVINMSEQLAKLGYEVTVYNRCGDMKGEYNGVTYLPYYHFNLKDTFNVLIGWRNPAMFMRELKAKKKYLWLHDIAYPQQFNQKIFDNVDKVLFLSKWHRSNLPELPEEKVFITNNGINPDHFKDLPEKRPNSLIWSSSYDRGLLPFIKNILPLIREEIPDVTLDVAYGWQNITKEMYDLPHLRELYEELSPILDNTPGIFHHGRISHKKLANLMGSSMVYPYASEFGETNNITSQKMQAAGVYVITTSQSGGTPERVEFGGVIDGNGIYTDKKLQKEFADGVITMLRKDWSRALVSEEASEIANKFAWSTTAQQWHNELL